MHVVIDTNVQLDNRHVTGNVGKSSWCEAIKHDLALTTKIEKHQLRAETLSTVNVRNSHSQQRQSANNDRLLLAASRKSQSTISTCVVSGTDH